MITKIKTTINPYGKEWLEKMRQVLPTVSKLNISEKRFLIDGNREALYITGHKLGDRKAFIGITKIYVKDTTLKIKTTVSVPHLFIGIILPILAIVIVWAYNKSIIFSTIATSIFILNPIYYIRDILKQDKFSNEIQKEIEQINGK